MNIASKFAKQCINYFLLLGVPWESSSSFSISV